MDVISNKHDSLKHCLKKSVNICTRFSIWTWLLKQSSCRRLFPVLQLAITVLTCVMRTQCAGHRPVNSRLVHYPYKHARTRSVHVHVHVHCTCTRCMLYMMKCRWLWSLECLGNNFVLISDTRKSFCWSVAKIFLIMLISYNLIESAQFHQVSSSQGDDLPLHKNFNFKKRRLVRSHYSD